MHKSLVLVSASPRRLELLKEIGISPEIFPAPVEELEGGLPPKEFVLHNARLKADWALERKPNALILAADTTVFLNGKIFNKPKDLEEAKAMLMELSGKTHQVYTGICLESRLDNINIEHCEVCEVTFRELDHERIENYFKIVNPLDKAGAYGIQEGRELIIESHTGSLNNIIGLPTEFLKEAFNSLKPLTPLNPLCEA